MGTRLQACSFSTSGIWQALDVFGKKMLESLLLCKGAASQCHLHL